MTLRDIDILMGAVLACLAGYVFLVQLSLPNIRGTRWVALSFLAGAGASWLVLGRGHVTPLITESLTGFCAIWVNVFVYWGFVEILRLDGRRWWIVWCTVVPETLLLAWFTFGHDDISRRVSVYIIFTGIQYAMLALLLFRHGTVDTRIPRYALGAVYTYWMCYRIYGLFRGTHVTALSQALSTPVVTTGPVARIFTALLTGHGFVWLAMAVLHGEVKRQSNTDSLTGLLNRRAIEQMATREMLVARRRHSPLAMILVDLDRFKSINDIHGHSVGDAVLSLTSWCLRENLRTVDYTARLGGEEFVAILPDTDQATAEEIAERLREAITTLRIPNLKQPLNLSASFGVTTFSELDPTWEEMLRRGDRALYRAKSKGRNRVEMEAAV